MAQRSSYEVLELEPLLDDPDAMADKRDSVDDKLDAEKVESHSVGGGVEETSPEERKLVRKLDSRIMPILCILYLFAYLDRSNLGNARLQGLPQDTLGGDPTGTLFDWVNTGFFFSYILCQIPATIASKLFPPRLWIGFATVGWGLSSTLMSTGFDFAGLMACRISLGIFEAAFGPGIPLYMSIWYTKREMGLRMAYWFGFAAVAGAFGGLIAFGIQQIHAAVADWRLLFIVEGVPTICLGLLTMWLLPDRPEETSFLTESERQIQLERMNRGLRADVGRTINKAHIKAAFKDWRIYMAGIIYFGGNCALASISAFLPTIIKTFGFTNARAQLLTVPPYAVCAVVLCLVSYVSDRLQSRGLYVALASALGAVGYLILLLATNVHARYFATFCITSGTYTVIGIVIAWFSHNLGSESKRATGIPLYMAIGQCGSILGSHLFPASEGPRYIKGFAVSCALEFLGSLVAVVLAVSYRIDNHQRDRKYGKVENTEATVETRELADKAPMFRYVP
ncbi:uncharacterized protein PHACADRAFT_252046 [Phanerochaete carnosa HHB-10118-sp]|uniref:Major facilitator superfamily (MFS) profile domain-containing protein n=1 Tax=Phanerochaete carnosa (strain HHB-10118-sp) TaxID=650164 RepID=K5WFH9_PHACS|nr:uncharacterized protein PHACADRAFT_252046 [Phanerochaete carnosa HHB-10118-sp]EKM58060.1 hypothetical protein PHACADRAFT_252046 [Phanerochaete carnosa HHB-10118-sp]